MKKIALYLRVSTGEQAIENQERDLHEAAARHGWTISAEFKDEGISGSKGRDKRPAFDRLCKAIVRREFDLVAAWLVDRLGRSLQDLVALLGEVQVSGIDLNLQREGLDTSTPAGKALFQMMGAFAEIRAGDGGPSPHGHRGRCRGFLAQGVGLLKTARLVG